MDRIADNLEDARRDAMVKTSAQIHANVVSRTPVDTGKARSNWRVSIGAPIGGEIDTFGPGSTASASSIAAGFAVFARYVPGEDIYIRNNVPYIGRLNRGYSKQAPAGYIEAEIDKAVGEVIADIDWVDR